MSLAVIYNDTLIADRCIILKDPHALGQCLKVSKIFVSPDMTFAYGSIGVTLSEKEKPILGAMIAEALTGHEDQHVLLRLVHEEWFNNHDGINVYVMTKKSTFIVTKSENTGRWYLNRVDPSIPVGGGTGIQVATVALLEGVPATELVPIVADVIMTVSPEFDIVHRKDLKEMKS